MDRNEINELNHRVIGAAIEVHRVLGPGLLEQTYKEALMAELALRGIKAQKGVPIECVYKGVKLDCAYRADIIVEDSIILELKATENDNPVYAKQLNTYLRITGKHLGLLINFNRGLLHEGLTRIVNNF